MPYYVDYDEQNNPIYTQKGRGRTKQGYFKGSDGNYYYDPDHVPTPTSTPTTQKTQSKVYLWFNEEDGKYKTHKVVGKGRHPKGAIKCIVHDSGELALCDGERLPENANLSTVPQEVGHFPTVDTDMGLSHSETEQDESEDEGQEVESHVEILSEPVDFNVICRYITGAWEREGNYYTVTMVDVRGTPPIEFLSQHPVQSRIDFDLKNRKIHIWEYEYRPNNPDVTLENAVEMQNIQKA